MKAGRESKDLASRFREILEWDWAYTEACSYDGRLHHVATLESPDAEIAKEWRSRGTSTCGLWNTWLIPGLISRMSRPRCSKCCDKLGWPRGVGSPKNDEALSPLVDARLRALGVPQGET